MMYDDINLVNLNNENENTKENKKMKRTFILKTNKSNLVRFARIQFFGMLLLCAAIIIVAIIIGNSKSTVQTITVEKQVKVVDQAAVDAAAQEKFEQYVQEYQPEVVEVEKIVEVEKPVTVTETVEVPVEVIKTVEVEKEVEKPVYIETVKTVEVIDNEAVQQLATEMAQQMYVAYKEAYVAQVDGEATQAAIDAKTAELQAEYTQLMSEYIAQADAEKVTTLATTMAQQMFEQFKADYVVEYAETQEAARVANTSIIRVLVYTPESYFFLEITGSLHDELTWDIILAILEADERFDGFKIKKIAHKNAVETFVGRDFESSRIIYLMNK